MDIQERLGQYTPVPLTPDLSALTENQLRMIPLLIQAAKAMEEIFWVQAYGDRETLLASIEDPKMRRYAQINYGPWDRLRGNEPFIEGVTPKPPGANFYPPDMTREEFERAATARPELKSPYTMVRRSGAGELLAIPYHEFFQEPVQLAADRLREAANIAEDPGLRRYLRLRAEALLTDDYQPSDLAWLDMKTNAIDLIIGPIETYEDQLFGYKAANESIILVKDRAWSERLARYARLLPRLQDNLPVPEVYRRERPGTDSDLNAYDDVYFAGGANAGLPAAVNLPNDEQVQLQKGTRSLQLKNAMRAKFDKILLPIAKALIAEDQVSYVQFDPAFSSVMFHEIAHGLGIKNTITGRGTVHEALQEQHSALEESKADVLGLYLVTQLHQWGELDETDLRPNYVTDLAGMLGVIRLGPSSAHGRANLVSFNFLKEMGVFARNADTGRYRVNFDAAQEAVSTLANRLLRLQGDGDYEGVLAFTQRYGQMDDDLKRDLDRLGWMGIPIDIVFEQGLEMLGLHS